MDSEVLAFAQVMAVLVPTIVVLIGAGVFAHWMVKRTNRLAAQRHEAVGDERLQRLELAVEAIAVEVERLGEGQRFVTKLLVEHTPELRAIEPGARQERVNTPR